jgi:hypothetical protein
MERFWFDAHTTQNMIELSGTAPGTTPFTPVASIALPSGGVEVEGPGGYGGVVEDEAPGYDIVDMPQLALADQRYRFSWLSREFDALVVFRCVMAQVSRTMVE